MSLKATFPFGQHGYIVCFVLLNIWISQYYSHTVHASNMNIFHEHEDDRAINVKIIKRQHRENVQHQADILQQKYIKG